MRVIIRWATCAAVAALIAVAAGAASTTPASAAGNTIVIAVMNDQSGVYADLAGVGAVAAANMAVEDVSNDVIGHTVKIVSVDHHNDPALAANKAKELYERDGVDAIVDLPTSSVALAVAGVAAEHKKIAIVTTGGTDALNMDKCNKYTFHYGYDTYALAVNTGTRLVEGGGKRWVMLTANYAFGTSLERNFAAAVEKAGGTVVKNVLVPFPNTDFSSYLLDAQAQRPNVIGLMNAGQDTVNAMKQINEFGLQRRGIKVGIGLLFESDVAAIGPDAYAGSTVTTGSYWNLDAQTRAFADRYKKRTGKRPTWVMMATYSAVKQYLDAIKRAKSTDPDRVVKALEGYKFEDVFARHAYIRAQDHLLIHDMYVAEVKPASEVKEPYDFFRIVKTVPGEQSYRKPSEVTCRL